MISQKSFNNAGQVCISVQRVYVHENVYDEFLSSLKAKTEGLKVGDPLDPETNVGPMIRLEEAERVETWVNEAVELGAAILVAAESVTVLSTHLLFLQTPILI